MADVISFENSFLPKKIKKYLDLRQWGQIERMIEQGVPLDLKMENGMSFWEMILDSYNKQFLNKRGQAQKLPKKLQRIMALNTPSDVIFSGKNKAATPCTIAAFYGQWGLLRDIVDIKEKGEDILIDSFDYSIWSAIMDGYLHRVGIKNYRYPGLEKDTYVSVLAKRVSDDEKVELIEVVGFLKPHAKQWPGRIDGHENFFILTAIMTFQNHVLQAFLHNGADVDCESFFKNEEGLQQSNRNPSFTAIEVGNLGAVKMLVNYNCEWNLVISEDGGGEERTIKTISLLEWACMCENNEMVSQLFLLGDGKIELYIEKSMRIATENNNLVILKNIQSNGGDVLGRDINGNNLLFVAAMKGSGKIISWLLENGLDWWDENESGITPYHILHHYNPQMLKNWELPHNEDYNVVSLPIP